jgi:hypothetical protein
LSQLGNEQGVLIRAASFYLRGHCTAGDNGRILSIVIIDNDDQKKNELRW